MKIKVISIFSALTLFFVFPSFAFAHAVVKPSEVKVAQYQTFVLGVPNEKDIPTTSIRLIVPEGVKSVSPNVKQGWKVTTTKTGEGEDAIVTEIVWSGGSIPVDMRDEFLFSAKSPSNATTLSWKVYQTYQNGVVVSWDQEAASTEESETTGPASHTSVVNDLTSTPNPLSSTTSGTASNKPFFLSIVALALSGVALVKSSIKK